MQTLWHDWWLIVIGAILFSVVMRALNRQGQPAQPVQPLADADRGGVEQLAREGKKIEAIKLYRQLTGASLRDAKAAVESLARGR